MAHREVDRTLTSGATVLARQPWKASRLQAAKFAKKLVLAWQQAESGAECFRRLCLVRPESGRCGGWMRQVMEG
jgi:hypothetical protein